MLSAFERGGHAAVHRRRYVARFSSQASGSMGVRECQRRRWGTPRGTPRGLFALGPGPQPDGKAACTHVDVWALHSSEHRPYTTTCVQSWRARHTLPCHVTYCVALLCTSATPLSRHLHLSTASTAVSRRCQQAAPATPPAVRPAVQTSCPDATRTHTSDVSRTSSTAVSMPIVLGYPA